MAATVPYAKAGVLEKYELSRAAADDYAAQCG
jgi:hypothetical protein